jgi:glycosyltransferase involved in cell wall biosynthesis
LLFIGALGWDERKGLDIALRTFAELVADPAFRHTLVVAGGGSASPGKRLASALKISHRVEFLAFSTDVPTLLSRADLLLSPTRYESYGLAIQEAIMAGVPPIVGRGAAGVTDRFPSDLTDLIVEDPESHFSWADRVRYALANLQLLRAKTRAAAMVMSQRTWRDFAEEFIDVVESRLRSPGTGI